MIALALAATLACQLHAIGPGYVVIETWWAHENPCELQWSCSSAEVYVPPAPEGMMWPLDPVSEGVPIGYVWRNAETGAILKSCGAVSLVPVQMPCSEADARIFTNGFESGTTDCWR